LCENTKILTQSDRSKVILDAIRLDLSAFWSNAMRKPTLLLTALVWVLVANAIASAQPQKKPMPPMPPDPPMGTPKVEKAHTKWDYRTVYASAFYTMSNVFDDAALSKVGADGWELVAINPGPPNQPGMAQFIFRRPIGGDKKAAPMPAPKAVDAQEVLVVNIYRLKNAKAVEVARLVEEVMQLNEQRMRIVPDPRTNQIVVNTTTAAHQIIEDVLARLDVPADLLPPDAVKKKD
jgi:hypothetical protein